MQPGGQRRNRALCALRASARLTPESGCLTMLEGSRDVGWCGLLMGGGAGVSSGGVSGIFYTFMWQASGELKLDADLRDIRAHTIRYRAWMPDRVPPKTRCKGNEDDLLDGNKDIRSQIDINSVDDAGAWISFQHPA
ncbi:hypothetical protein E4U38_003296 [Claviceps purpurea]|nr:hypothetical protein E4U38_003296 [Claviceps purpurea]